MIYEFLRETGWRLCSVIVLGSTRSALTNNGVSAFAGLRRVQLRWKSPTTTENMKTKITIPLGPAANTPGDILREEFLIPMGLTIRDMARKTGCGPMTVSEIVRGKRSVTARTSILMGKALGISPGFFLGLQMDHDLACAAIAMGEVAA